MKLVTKFNDVNYQAKIIYIDRFRPHTDPEVTRIKCCTVDGFNCITDIDAKPGFYVYFPGMSCINPEFLSYANLFRHAEKNVDDTKTGLFEDNGRVKTVKLRGELSEGFIITADVLHNWILSVTNQSIDINEVVFDSVEHNGKTFWVCKKYVAKASGERSHGRTKAPKTDRYSEIIENQFRLHYETVLIKKCPNVIKPNDIIHISTKFHGTSGGSAYVLCKNKLNWKQKIANYLTKEEFNSYKYLYHSRKVIKTFTQDESGYYKTDVWRYADEIVKSSLIKGMQIYYEIIGYTPDGAYIQKDFDYGCIPPDNQYLYNRNFKVLVYRITLTNVDGVIHEFSAKEVQQYCLKVGLTPVTELYYGYAKDLYPDIPCDDNFSETFINKLADDTNFHMECNSPDCKNKVPHEGVVIKIENMKSEAFKLKCFKFLNKEQKELDNGIENIEDNN
jgi:hypothetical protein